MRTHHVSVFGVATMVVILIATGLAARLAEVGLVAAVRLTSVGGGGLLTPANLAGADHRHVTYALVRLLLPGLLLQALMVKLVVSSYRGLHITYLATVAVLGLFDIAALALANVVATTFATEHLAACAHVRLAGCHLPVGGHLGRDADRRGLRAAGPDRAAGRPLSASSPAEAANRRRSARRAMSAPGRDVEGAVHVDPHGVGAAAAPDRPVREDQLVGDGQLPPVLVVVGRPGG